MTTVTAADLRDLIEALKLTRDDEIGCDDASAAFARRAEEELSGMPVSEATRLVAQHLLDCPECEEEYRALLAMLESLEAGPWRP